jgi:hypothetical protein
MRAVTPMASQKMMSRNKSTMSKKQDTEAKKPWIFDICYCPVCDAPRNKGNHAKCSKITKLKHMKERGELK